MNRNVLLVDDNPQFREGITTWFEGTGYTFFEADGPSEGVRMLAANPQIQVIMLDLEFPDDDVPGMGVLDFVHERPGQYRAIILTAHEELMDADRAVARDVFHYLPKSQHFNAIRFSLDQAFNDLERAALARKIRSLLEVQQQINAGDDITTILDLICESVRVIVGAYTCHIRVYDFAGGDFYLAGLAPDGLLRDSFSVPRVKGELFSGTVVATGQPTTFDNLQNTQAFLAFKKSACEGRTMSPEETEYWATVRSVYIVPISTGLFGRAVDAVLNVSSQSPGFFDEDKRALVDEFVSQASLAITKDWLQRTRAEIHEDYSSISEMLGDMRDRLAGPDVLHRVYRTVTQKLSHLVQAEVVSIFLYNEQTHRIENVAEYRGGAHVEAPDEEYEVGQSFVGWGFENEKPLQLQTSLNGMEPLADPRFDHSRTERYGSIIPSGTLEHYLAVPITAGGTTQGVLQVMNKKSAYYDEIMRSAEAAGSGEASNVGRRFGLLERGFSADARSIVEITASHLAIAIQLAYLLEEREWRVQQLQTLGRVGRIISSELDIDSVLEQTIQAMATVMQAEICMLFLKEDRQDRVVLNKCYGIPETELAGASYAIGEGVTGTVAATATAKLISNTEGHDGKYDSQIRGYLTERDGRPRKIKSLMVVPIIAKSTILGVLKVINKVGNDPHYRISDLRLFETLGQYVGVAVENAHIYEFTNRRLAIVERGAVLADLVRAVAHEINNTAGLIPANIQAIRNKLGPANASVEGMLGLIDDVANQATEFANEITGFSATRRGQSCALDLNEVIRNALKELEAGRYAAHLTTSLAEQPLICVMFENPFKQIVRNIIINAFQALERTEHGAVLVTTAEGTGALTGWAIVEFVDNGAGIRPEHMERIFEADFTTKPNGNGIGLWLVRKQLELIEGNIEVASEPGAGSRFRVMLPLALAADHRSDA